MAHVLLPCDLPNWSDIQKELTKLKTTNNTELLVEGMIRLYDMCSISLEPEDVHHERMKDLAPSFEELRRFLDELITAQDKAKFFKETLPKLVSQALCLRLVKPPGGFLYSLKREEISFELDRNFVKSLLANAFFSTFPKRTRKTHPSLQNFSFCEFFQHLNRRSHQKKFKAFLRYFQNSAEKNTSFLRFSRKVSQGRSLPAWLCSDKALVPLIVRQEGNIHDEEPNISRAFTCSSLVGGDVLQAATSQESSLFYAFPELLCCLCFVEELEENEALVVHNAIPHGICKSRKMPENEVSICLMDTCTFNTETNQQFEDRFLLRDLNKALAAFSLGMDGDGEVKQRRQTPVGESSSSEQLSVSSTRKSPSTELGGEGQISRSPSSTKFAPESKELKKSSYLPLITSGGRLPGGRTLQEIPSSSVPLARQLPKLSAPIGPMSKKTSESSLGSIASAESSTRSLETASESSFELPPISPMPPQLKHVEEEYYTADEDSDECSMRDLSNKISRCKCTDLHSLLHFTSGLIGKRKLSSKAEKESSFSLSRDSSIPGEVGEGSSKLSETAGFVLGGTGSDDDFPDIELDEGEGGQGPPTHERLEDFRQRIRRRTRRHLSRRMRNSSRSSYSLGSSTSSDMEDISEEEDPDTSFLAMHPQVMRTSNSEPSLAAISNEVVDLPPFVFKSGCVVVTVSGRRVAVTASNGRLKAYSYDGVNPNLPVPFKVKFRRRQQTHSLDENATHRIEASKGAIHGLCSGIGKWNSFTEPSEKPSGHTSSTDVSAVHLCRRTTQEKEHEDMHGKRGAGSLQSVAVGPSRSGDAQLRVLILWLAASMAGLPSLIVYTGDDFHLYELARVYRNVLSREWTVGDLSCELLRFCRNRISARGSNCSPSLFEQLLCTIPIAPPTTLTFSQHSLD